MTVPAVGNDELATAVLGDLEVPENHRFVHVDGTVWLVYGSTQLGDFATVMTFRAVAGLPVIDVVHVDLAEAASVFSPYLEFAGRTHDGMSGLLRVAESGEAALRGIAVTAAGAITVGPVRALGAAAGMYVTDTGFGYYGDSTTLYVVEIAVSPSGVIDLTPPREYAITYSVLGRRRLFRIPSGKVLTGDTGITPTRWLPPGTGRQNPVDFTLSYDSPTGPKIAQHIYPGAPGGRVVVDYRHLFGGEIEGDEEEHPERNALLLDSSDRVLDVLHVPDGAGTLKVVRDGSGEYVLVQLGTYPGSSLNVVRNAVFQVVGSQFVAVGYTDEFTNTNLAGLQAGASEILAVTDSDNGSTDV